MSYKMFIDDERFPPDDGGNWLVCRTMVEVISCIEEYGMPDHISFDHDLTDNEPTGYEIAKKLVDMDMDGLVKFPQKFSFYVHSQNPVGAMNIRCYLSNYLESR